MSLVKNDAVPIHLEQAAFAMFAEQGFPPWVSLLLLLFYLCQITRRRQLPQELAVVC